MRTVVPPDLARIVKRSMALALLAVSVEFSRPFPAAAQAIAPEDVALLSLPLPPRIEGLAVLSEMRPKGRVSYLGLLTREAERRGLPPAVADAVAHVESGYNPGTVGSVGEVGLMQVRVSTAAMLGHQGSVAELFIPEINIRYGVAYLAEAWRLAKGDLCRALMKYRAGHGEERMTQRSATYCRRARAHLASVGSPLEWAPVPAVVAMANRNVPVQTGPAVPRSKTLSPRLTSNTGFPDKQSLPAVAQKLWAAHAARVRAIETRIDRVMSGS